MEIHELADATIDHECCSEFMDQEETDRGRMTLKHLMILQRIHTSCKREFSLPPWEHGLEFMPWNTQHEGFMVTILQPVCITNWFLVDTRSCVTQEASEMFVKQTYILNRYFKKKLKHMLAIHSHWKVRDGQDMRQRRIFCFYLKKQRP